MLCGKSFIKERKVILYKTRKTVMSPLLLSISIITIVLSTCVFLFLTLFPPALTQMKKALGVWITSGLLFLGGPIVILISTARRCFSVITISEKGISRVAFGVFFKLSMKWDEIYEISYFESGMPFLIFSQTKSIQGLSYWKITKIKNLIQLQLTQKNYDVVKQYIQQPIIGLTEEKMGQLKLK